MINILWDETHHCSHSTGQDTGGSDTQWSGVGVCRLTPRLSLMPQMLGVVPSCQPSPRPALGPWVRVLRPPLPPPPAAHMHAMTDRLKQGVMAKPPSLPSKRPPQLPCCPLLVLLPSFLPGTRPQSTLRTPLVQGHLPDTWLVRGGAQARPRALPAFPLARREVRARRKQWGLVCLPSWPELL